jgi:hypothetical protein
MKGYEFLSDLTDTNSLSQLVCISFVSDEPAMRTPTMRRTIFFAFESFRRGVIKTSEAKTNSTKSLSTFDENNNNQTNGFDASNSPRSSPQAQCL